MGSLVPSPTGKRHIEMSAPPRVRNTDGGSDAVSNRAPP